MVGYDFISVNASHTISIGALIVVLIGIENCKRSSSGIVERGKFRDTRWGNSRPLVEARKRAIKQQLILIYPKQVSNPHEAQEYERCLRPAMPMPMTMGLFFVEK